MTAQAKKSALRRILAAAIPTLALAALIGCNSGTDSPKNPCKNDPTLCTERSTLRDSGEVLFENCTGCHGHEGEGGRGPRLANSDFFMNNRERVISILIRGNQDTLTVNGVCVTGGGMPPGGGVDEISQSNFRIASLISYIRMVLNDSIPSNCNANGECTMTKRAASAMDLDSVAVWEVKAVRDTLKAYPEDYAGAICPDPV